MRTVLWTFLRLTFEAWQQKLLHVWKFPKPADSRVAQELMSAAYQTAIATNPNACEVLIRWI
jgi:hypothetical protein